MLNYHFDSITADNGDADFSRVPIEATLFYTGVPQWRFGGGARWVQNPKKLRLNFYQPYC